MDFFRDCRVIGFALLGYDWIYIPTVRWLGVEPWGATKYGLVAFAAGVVGSTIVKILREDFA